MKKLAIIGSPSAWHTQDLMRAATGIATVESVSFSELQSSLPRQSGPPIDSDHDAVIVRNMPPGSLEQVIFRMDALGVWATRGTPIINPPHTLEIAIDKYLCLAKLEQANIPVPRTITCQTQQQACIAFHQLGSDVVVKPIFGGQGRSLMRINDEDLAIRAFRWLEQTQAIIYLQEFIQHPGFDVRMLVLGDQLYAIRREHSTDWRTNASRGAKCSVYEPKCEEAQWAHRACQEIGAVVAGIDLIYDPNGTPFVIEVNAVPGWRSVALAHHHDIARLIINLTTQN